MKSDKKIYLDIDGVLLTVKQTKPAKHSWEFIQYIVSHFDCYWLTTHCKGDASNAIKYLTSYFDGQTLQLLGLIKPTNWTTLKTEAIDLAHDFVWIEDYPFNAEKEVLLNNNTLERLVEVNLNNEDELIRVMNLLKKFAASK